MYNVGERRNSRYGRMMIVPVRQEGALLKTNVLLVHPAPKAAPNSARKRATKRALHMCALSCKICAAQQYAHCAIFYKMNFRKKFIVN